MSQGQVDWPKTRANKLRVEIGAVYPQLLIYTTYTGILQMTLPEPVLSPWSLLLRSVSPLLLGPLLPCP
jgi:hypothetical protein